MNIGKNICKIKSKSMTEDRVADWGKKLPSRVFDIMGLQVWKRLNWNIYMGDGVL